MVTVTILGALGIGFSGRVGAQVADVPEAAAKGAGVQLVSPEAVPRFGTFYLMQQKTPPWPFNPFPDLPVYWFGEGPRFLVDDSAVDYVTLRAPALATQDGDSPTMLLLSDPPPPPGGGGGGGGGSTNSWGEATGFDYGTNLYFWSLVHGITNQITNVIVTIASTPTNASHDLYLATNLAYVSFWEGATQGVAFSFVTNLAAGQTNLTLTNLAAAVSFFGLSRRGDADGDGLNDGDEFYVLKSDPTAGDTDGDGFTDDWEWLNGMNLRRNELAAPITYGRNYTYDAAGRLNEVGSRWTFRAAYDAEGNLKKPSL